MHGKLAHWLAGRSGLRANDFLGAAAEHFEAAGDDANAAEFHARAAEHAKSRFAHQAVLSHVQRALELLNRQLPERNGELLRWRLLEARERALHLQGDRARQLSDIDALERSSPEALDDDRRRARVASLRARRLDRMGDFFGAEAAATQRWHGQRVRGRRNPPTRAADGGLGCGLSGQLDGCQSRCWRALWAKRGQKGFG